MTEGERVGAGRRRVTSLNRLTVAILAASLALSIRPLPVAANHTANCSEPGAAVNRWTGVEVAGNKHGAAGRLEGQSLDMCTAPEPTWEASGSFAFVNVVGPGMYDIVQAGIGRCRAAFLPDCSWNMEVIATWGRTDASPGCAWMGDVWPIARRVAAYDGATWDYKVFHKENRWRMYRGGTQIASVGEASICWTPRAAQWFDESHDFGDAIGGFPQDKHVISDMNYANAEGGGFFWTNFNPDANCHIGPGAPNPNGPPFRCDIATSRSVHIWTSR